MNYQAVLNEIQHCAQHPVELITVSKEHSWAEMEPAYKAGCRDFGESRLQEAFSKQQEAPANIRWHFIGPLQKNKVRKALGRFHLIHSVDSLELAEKISQCSLETRHTTPLLLQVNTSGESTKQGFSPTTLRTLYPNLQALPSIRIEGLMTLAPFTLDTRLIQRCFADLRHLRDELAQTTHLPHTMHHLSMGMSHDYLIALQEGATLLRIGTILFEKREKWT